MSSFNGLLANGGKRHETRTGKVSFVDRHWAIVLEHMYAERRKCRALLAESMLEKSTSALPGCIERKCGRMAKDRSFCEGLS